MEGWRGTEGLGLGGPRLFLSGLLSVEELDVLGITGQ